MTAMPSSHPEHTLTQPQHTHIHAPAPAPGGAPVAMETSCEVWQRERRREHSELGEFELLEAAAEDVSLSSCSSSFLQALRSSHTHTHTHIHTHTHTHTLAGEKR